MQILVKDAEKLLARGCETWEGTCMDCHPSIPGWISYRDSRRYPPLCQRKTPRCGRNECTIYEFLCSRRLDRPSESLDSGRHQMSDRIYFAKNRRKVSVDHPLSSCTSFPLVSLALVIRIAFVDPLETVSAVCGTWNSYLDSAIHIEQNRPVCDRFVSKSCEHNRSAR